MSKPDAAAADAAADAAIAPTDARVVLCTFPSADQASEIARALVEERLCACVNVLPGVRSIYRWEDAVHDEPEVLAILKTTAARYEALARRIAELHPYQVPEILALSIIDGHAPYLAWLAGATR